VNWKAVDKNKEGVGLLGFVGYKVGMVSVWAKDNTSDSMTKNKSVSIPSTVIECPSMKIYSVRFYNQGNVVKEVVVSNEKILNKKVKSPKKMEDSSFGNVGEFDEVRVILYSVVGKTSVGKKKPNLIEVGISGGNKDEKLEFVKGKIGKEIEVSEVFSEGLVDVRGVTKGKGTQGPVKRFGIALKASKSEKGQRRPGSLAPWHPARVTFRAAMAGQMGYNNRLVYNSKILKIGSGSELDKKGGFNGYGKINTNYIIVRGSVPGPKKRGLIITPSFRKSKKQDKKNFEVLEVRL